MKLFIWKGTERREVDATPLPDGSLVYESPWTGKKIVIPLEPPRKRRFMWTATEVYKLEARLEKSRRCPDRPATTQRPNE